MADEYALDTQRDKFEIVATPGINFDREIGFAIQILSQNPYLASVARNNKASLYSAVLNVASIGISLNPAWKLAYLVPRKNSICLDISYMGLLHIAQTSEAIQWGQARIVRKQDNYSSRGIDRPPMHEYSPFLPDAERGDIVGVYVVIKTHGGDYLTHEMNIGKVYSIRDRSESWKSYMKDKKITPWKTDEEEMIKKTCIKQAYKYWPRKDRLDSAINYLNTEADEGIVFDDGDTYISDNEISDLNNAIKSMGIDENKFCSYLGVIRLEDIRSSDYPKACRAIDAKKRALGLTT